MSGRFAGRTNDGCDDDILNALESHKKDTTSLKDSSANYIHAQSERLSVVLVFQKRS